MTKTDVIQISFLRHGKTKGNLEKRYVGRTDESIIIKDTVSYYKDSLQGRLHKRNKIYVSPMKRCLETAEICYPAHSYEVCPSLRECDFGKFEYKNYQELAGEMAYQMWIDSNGTLPFPEGETTEAFKKRCQEGFLEIMKDAILCGVASIGLVVHGGTIMAIMEKFAVPHKNYFEWQTGNLEGYEGEVHIAYEEVVGKEVPKIDKTKEEMSHIEISKIWIQNSVKI